MLAITVTLGQMARAFQAWEIGYRVSPELFMTPDEVAEARVDELSADRASYFYELLAAAK